MPSNVNSDDFSFSCSWRVRFSEVDLQGVVHHSEIIKYLEIGRVEYWRHLGLGYDDLRKSGYEFVVARLECDFLRPLYFDKMLEMHVRTSGISRTSVKIDYMIKDETGQLSVVGNTLLVCVAKGSGKPSKLPEKYVSVVRDFEKPGTVGFKSSREMKAEQN